MSADLLIELGCEDLPARYVQPLAQALMDGIAKGLDEQLVQRGEARRFATPRRIAVLVKDVAAKQLDRNVERKGPKLAVALEEGAPTPAALGFARSCGVEFAQLLQEAGQLVFRSVEKGRPTSQLLPEIFEQTLKAMDELVPKRMRWGAGEETFVRPVQWIAALLGAAPLPLKHFGLKAGTATFGHRSHAPRAIKLRSPADYEPKLKAAKVWADFESRKAEIRKQIEAEARKLKGAARITDELLGEVTALVEWPVVISGRMEERFLELPPEVVIATIEHNQRYFPVLGKDGRLLPHFITVSNIQSRDVRQVIAGNERVVRPRLTDALFFWEQDRKRKLAEFLPELDRVTFQKDLGSIGDKSRRIAALAAHIAGLLKEDTGVVQRAAELCKADLVTRMVFEFPELQGVMGGYYAAASGESAAVAQAIREHYLPAQSGGATPSTRPGQIVALADKLDTLAGIFAIGHKPSASKDPYALRRAALGALRICIERALPLDLRALLKRAHDAQPAGKRDDQTLAELWDFVLERLRYRYFEEYKQREMDSLVEEARDAKDGVVADVGALQTFNAVVGAGISNPYDFDKRFRATYEFWKTPEAKSLAAAHKRVRNILRQVGEQTERLRFRPELLTDTAERELDSSMQQFGASVHQAVGVGDYGSAFKILASFQRPVDSFFEKVMVMADDPELRVNRIHLLRNLDRLCRSVADISALPG